MLAAVDVRVFPRTDVELPHPSAHLLHAAVLRMVEQTDPRMSAVLHDGEGAKPLTVSTLWPRTRAQGDRLVIPKFTPCRFRVCCLTRPVFDAVASPLFAAMAGNAAIRLHGAEFAVAEASLEPPYGGAATFAEIYSDIGPSVALRFVSPTTFRRKGLNVPLPDPGLVYGSLWQRWKQYSDIGTDEVLFDEMIGSLALSGADIHTRVWKFPRFKMMGFVGIARFELVRSASVESRKLFGALSTLAFYSGVGYRTTMGMGQCALPLPQDALTDREARETEEDPQVDAARDTEASEEVLL